MMASVISLTRPSRSRTVNNTAWCCVRHDIAVHLRISLFHLPSMMYTSVCLCFFRKRLKKNFSKQILNFEKSNDDSYKVKEVSVNHQRTLFYIAKETKSCFYLLKAGTFVGCFYRKNTGLYLGVLQCRSAASMIRADHSSASDELSYAFVMPKWTWECISNMEIHNLEKIKNVKKRAFFKNGPFFPTYNLFWPGPRDAKREINCARP